MVTTTAMGELVQLAKAHLLAKSAFNRAWCRFCQAELQPSSEDLGWKLLEVFRSEVDKFYFKLKRQDGIEQAAQEIFRKELVGESDYSFEDLVGFAKWYGTLKSRIDSAIGHFYEFQCDSFADLVDSYPLAGRELVERALATHPKSDRPRREGYLDEQEVVAAVLEKLGPHWHELICEGENYVASALETSCRKYYLHRILTGGDEQVAWTDDEQSAVDFAGHYND